MHNPYIKPLKTFSNFLFTKAQERKQQIYYTVSTQGTYLQYLLRNQYVELHIKLFNVFKSASYAFV